MTFPFVASAVEEDRLTLHGLWNDIGDGALQYCRAEDSAFVPV